MAKCGVAGPDELVDVVDGRGSGWASTWMMVGGSGHGGDSTRGEHLAFAPVRHRVPADVLLLVTVLFWSFNFTVVKYALTHGWEPLAYSSLRFAVGAVIFSAFTFAREGTLRVDRVDVRFMIVVAALGIWLNQLTFTYAVRLTTAATVALMFGTLPIFVALVALAFGLERLHARHWLATVVSFLGRRARRGRSGDRPQRRPGRDPARPRRLGHLGRVLRGDGAVDAALLAVPDQRLHADRRLDPAARLRRAPACGAGLDRPQRSRVGLLLLQPLLLPRLHEHLVVHGDRPGRRGAGLALCQPAPVPGRVLRARRALGGDGPAPVRGRGGRIPPPSPAPPVAG